jgi:hypothetical protein
LSCLAFGISGCVALAMLFLVSMQLDDVLMFDGLRARP